MSPQTGSIILCFMLTFAVRCQGLKLSMDTTRDSDYCGHLQCLADKSTTEDNISSIISLTVYDVTQPTIRIKLASLSVFSPDLCLPEIIGINTTGNISTSHGELTLGLRNHSSCLAGSFMCELQFVNTSCQPDVIRETLSPQNCGSYDSIVKEVAKLRQENVELKVQVSELQKIVNASRDISQVTCLKGVTHNSSRKKFLLWGKVPALCDTETDGGGWVIIQRRTKGDVDFYRGWEEYKNGFGTPDTDFWIGNDVIHNLTSQGYTELRVDMEYNGTQHFAHFSHFEVADETSLYRLSVSGTSQLAKVYALFYHNGSNFSTFDKDNDGKSNGNCASQFHGAWWYNSCLFSNLNGMWGAGNYSGVLWLGVIDPGSVSFSEMKVRHG